MKLTKYEHACFTLEKDDKILIVDPGEWTTNLGTPTRVVAIVVTHEHADHFLPETITSILASNPEARVYAHESVLSQLDNSFPTQAVNVGDRVEVGPFQLEFFGGQHALIYGDMPIAANLCVMVNDSLYYPGDSFAQPNRPVKVLAVPASAPWMKLAEAIDFSRAVNADFAFPTHDAILSDSGKALVDKLLSSHSKSYQRLTTTPIEIDG